MRLGLHGFLGVGLLAILASNCGVNSAETNGDATYLAIELKAQDEGVLRGNVTLFSIENNEIVPTFRLGPDDSVVAIEINENFGSPTAEAFYGFPRLRDGRIAYVSRDSDSYQLVVIDSETGEKSRVLNSETGFTQIVYYKQANIFFANTMSNDDGKCFIINESLEPQRIGSGQCVATKNRLWLVSVDKSETRISELNKDYEVIGRRTIASPEVTLSHSGRLILSKSAYGLLEIRAMSSGDVVWSANESDRGAELLASADQSDSFIVGIDADDDDGEIEAVWLRLEDGVRIDSLGSDRSVSATLSQAGDLALIKWVSSENAARFSSTTLSGASVLQGNDLTGTNAWILEPNKILIEDDEVLYLFEGNSAPQRVMDIYGELASTPRYSADSRTLLISTLEKSSSNFEKETLTVVTFDGKRWKSTEVFSVNGTINFRASNSNSVLVTSFDEDEYGSLYEVDISGDVKPRRIAEGGIRSATYGPDGLVYFADVSRDVVDIFQIKVGDRKSRTQVSSRYMVERFGPETIRFGNGPYLYTMIAVVDPLLAYCRANGIQILDAKSSSVTFDIERSTEGTLAGCVRLRPTEGGESVNFTIESTEDLALEWIEYELAEGQTPETGGLISRIVSSDDVDGSQNPALSFKSEVTSAILRIYSWGESTTAKLRAGTAPSNFESTEFDSDRYRADAQARNECIGHALISGTEIKRVKVGVYPTGLTGETPFCILFGSQGDDARRLVMNPIETGAPAALTVQCTKDYSYFKRSFRSDRPSSEDSGDGYTFSRSLKGLIGLCTLSHYRSEPSAYGWGTWGEVDIGLQR